MLMITGTIDMLRRLTNEPSTSGTYTDSLMTQYLNVVNGDLYGAGYLVWQEKVSGLLGAADDYSHFMLSFCASHRGVTSSLWIKDPPEADSEEFQ